MPKGPQGQKRPADSIGLAVMIGKIATGEIKDDADQSADRAKAAAVGGNARAAKLTPGERSSISQRAALTRWEKNKAD